MPRAADPDIWDLEASRALLRRLYEHHERNDNLECHRTAIALAEHLWLVRLIVPQHPLWSINVYRRCDFRCVYCSVWAQGAARPVLEGDELRRRLRLELQVIPRGHHTVLSSQSDAYVPAEANLGVARIAIEELIGAARCVHVVTKGTTVLRDVDLLRRAGCGKVEISLSTLREDIAAEIEPGAPTPSQRLALVEALAAAGVDVGISLAPWIPEITDVAAILAVAGRHRRITISPLKCNGHGAQVLIAGRVYSQQLVNRRYSEERARFEPLPLVKWEPPWNFGDHYLARYRPLSLHVPGDSPFRHDSAPTQTQRVLRLLSASGLWAVAGRVHTALYRFTAGRLGQRMGAAANLLLTTTGRNSGQSRTVVVSYVPDGPRWVVVASNGGADRHPAWWLNLQGNPRATVDVAGARTAVLAREANRLERRRLWPILRHVMPMHRQYEQMTARHVPVVILEPLTHSSTAAISRGASSPRRPKYGESPDARRISRGVLHGP
jgi:deazaflavin-dependent oxidoreductase (nitroreductase family)